MHINPTIGNLRLSDIRRSHCARILSMHAGESDSKVQKIRATAFQILESAVNDDIIPEKSHARVKDAGDAIRHPSIDHRRGARRHPKSRGDTPSGAVDQDHAVLRTASIGSARSAVVGYRLVTSASYLCPTRSAGTPPRRAPVCVVSQLHRS